MAETKLTKEELTEQINTNVTLMKQRIIDLNLQRTKSQEIVNLLRFYQGNELLQIDMAITVNLHKIKTERMLSTSVNKYVDTLKEAIVKNTAEIEAYGNTLEQFANVLIKDEDNEKETKS